MGVYYNIDIGANACYPTLVDHQEFTMLNYLSWTYGDQPSKSVLEAVNYDITPCIRSQRCICLSLFPSLAEPAARMGGVLSQ